MSADTTINPVGAQSTLSLGASGRRRLVDRTVRVIAWLSWCGSAWSSTCRLGERTVLTM